MNIHSLTVAALPGDLADDLGAFLIYAAATELGKPVLVEGGKLHNRGLFYPGLDSHGLDFAERRAELADAAQREFLPERARAWLADVLAGEKPNHAEANARGWLSTIAEMLAAMRDGREYEGQDARGAIQESPLSVLVRQGWYAPGSHAADAEEYEILLSTGGPALRIVGELGEFCQPDDAPRLEWQDWGIPWTPYPLDETERESVCEFARQFWFGE